MDHRSTRDKDTEVDLESGLAVNEDDSKKVCTPGKTLFAKVSGGFCGGSVKAEDEPNLYCNESNLNGVSTMDLMKVTNNSLAGQDSVGRVEKTPVKEKCKKNRKAPKPPRPLRGPSLDAANQKLIKEISELVMLKRATIERVRALKKMKATKSSSSSSSLFALVFTIIFCVVIIFQGMSSGKNSVANFQGSPVSSGGTEGGLISVQSNLNPSASDPNAPGSEVHNFMQQVAGLDLLKKSRYTG